MGNRHNYVSNYSSFFILSDYEMLLLSIFFRYEYIYGVHPFANADSKIMQILIKSYPVSFPDTPLMPHEF